LSTERKDVYMGATRRQFTLEYRIEAAHRVIDSNRSLAEVAKELSLVPDTLGRWVREERRRMSASGDKPLSPTERVELLKLEKKVAEQEKDLAISRKERRTSQQIHQSRAVRADGGGVRQFRDLPHGKALSV